MSKITALQNLLAKDPEDAMTRYMLAIELSKEGQFAEAAHELEEYLKNVKDEGAAYRILADAYLKIGKKKGSAVGATPGCRSRARLPPRRNGGRVRREVERNLIGSAFSPQSPAGSSPAFYHDQRELIAAGSWRLEADLTARTPPKLDSPVALFAGPQDPQDCGASAF